MSRECFQPRVTVITVCYNAAFELERTIISVLSQTYANVEYIIVDGGSQDNTKEIINSFDGKVSKWISEPDKGVYDAMNKGIGLASGEWILFMNAGDTFKNDSVLSEIFSKDYPNEVGVLYGDADFLFPSYGTVLKRMDKLKGKDQALSICHQASLTRSAHLKEIRFDLSYRIAADANAFFILWNKNVGFEYVPVCIATYEAVAGISSTRFVQAFRERAKIQGFKWYNSFQWWMGYSKAFLKNIQRMIHSSDEYERLYYKRISKKNKLSV